MLENGADREERMRARHDLVMTTNDYLLSSAPNFRDLGGTPSAHGRSVRRGRLFRSEHLGNLSEEDICRLGSFNIQLVCDLRGESERLRHPSRWLADVPETLCLDITADLRAGRSALVGLFAQNPTLEQARLFMCETYRQLPAHSLVGLRQLFERLADGGTPAIIHCTAGKDRTGFICASLLQALEVPYEVILADYLLSRERIDRRALSIVTAKILQETMDLNLPLDVLDAVNDVAPEYLNAAYTAVIRQFGSFDAYLEAAGAHGSLRRRLQESLLGG
jgi:protein-tyrosine phosphatase